MINSHEKLSVLEQLERQYDMLQKPSPDGIVYQRSETVFIPSPQDLSALRMRIGHAYFNFQALVLPEMGIESPALVSTLHWIKPEQYLQIYFDLAELCSRLRSLAHNNELKTNKGISDTEKNDAFVLEEQAAVTQVLARLMAYSN